MLLPDIIQNGRIGFLSDIEITVTMIINYNNEFRKYEIKLICSVQFLYNVYLCDQK